jgi:hypothetical protein
MTVSIAVIGAGPVGAALARGLAGAGHDVAVGVRSPDDPKHEAVRGDVPVRAIGEAVDRASVVVLAVPMDTLGELLRGLVLRPGHVVVDATNAVRHPVPAGFDTVGAYVASLLPGGVHLVKAFNTIGAEHLRTGRVGGTAAFLPIAGDDEGRALVAGLARDLGFEVAELGGRDTIRLVEDFARLWIHLAFRCGWGRDFGFAVVRS